MSLGKLVSILALAALVIPVTGCSDSGTSEGTNAISSAVQDIVVDPDGNTTVVTFSTEIALIPVAGRHQQSNFGSSAHTLEIAFVCVAG